MLGGKEQEDENAAGKRNSLDQPQGVRGAKKKKKKKINLVVKEKDTSNQRGSMTRRILQRINTRHHYHRTGEEGTHARRDRCSALKYLSSAFSTLRNMSCLRKFIDRVFQNVP